MATQSVKIPVELEINSMQSQIKSLKKALDGIKPDSASYSKLNTQIEKLENKMALVAKHSKQSFSSTSEINAFEREFKSLADNISSVGESFSKVRFSELVIDSNSLKSLEEQQRQIDKLKLSLQNLENTDLKELAKNNLDVSESLKITGLEGVTLTYDKVIEKLNKKELELERKIEEVTQRRDETLKRLSEIKDFSAQQEQLNNAFQRMIGPDDFFNNKGSLTKQSKANLSNWLRTTFEVDDKEFSKILNATKDTIISEYHAFQEAINKKREELQRTVNNQNTELKGFEVQQTAVVTAKTKIIDSKEVNSSSEKIQGLQEKIKELQTALASNREKLRQSSQALRESSQVASDTSDTILALSNAVDKARIQYDNLAKVTNKLNSIQIAINRFFGLNEVINLVKRAVNSAVVEIKELDNVMTEIAVVTDMTQEDLWNQIAAYSAIAQQYGVSTKGVYEVSQLYYQQGLQTAEVMNLTTETLKMAKIAGLDYATATDYMTVAIRGFKLEMSDAQTVTDVYSALAAATASDTEELAVAMSKTASSAEAVGASFESTSAMIATMVSITREAPENIGSALKSIISRYGEMTTDPLKLVDAEGEEMSLNKVDKALRSVGISLQDANGQFRNFDDVILELAESWDTIDTNTQRYIATIMAGNRQQSRFLALVGNVEEYKNALETAANAEDAGTLQYLKTMDSIETKLQQVKTAWEQFYSSMGIEDLFKGTLELITKIIQNINKLGKVQALGNLFSVFSGAKTLITSAFSSISKKVSDLMSKLAESRKLMEQKIELQANTEKIEQQIKNVAEQLEQAGKIEVTITNAEEAAKQIQDIKNGVAPAAQPVVTPVSTVTESTLASAWKKVQNSGFYKYNTENFKANKLGQLKNYKNLQREYFGGLTEEEAKVLSKRFQELNQSSHTAAQAMDKLNKELEEQARLAAEAAKQQKPPSSPTNKDEDVEKDLPTEREKSNKLTNLIVKNAQVIGASLSVLGSALTAVGLTIEDTSDKALQWSKVTSGGGTVLAGLGSGLTTFAQTGSVAMGVISALPQVIIGVTQLFDGLTITTAERIQMLTNELADLQDEATVKKGESLTLKNTLDEFYQLEKAQYDSAEASQAFTEKMNEIGEKYPSLIESMDASGNAIIDAQKAEQLLTESRYEAAKAALQALETEYKLKKEQNKKIQEVDKNWQDFSIQGTNYSFQVEEDWAAGLRLDEDQIKALSLFQNGNSYFKLEKINGFLGKKEVTTLSQAGIDFVNSILENYTSETISELSEAERQLIKTLGLDTRSSGQTETFDFQELSLEDLYHIDGPVFSLLSNQVKNAAEQLGILSQVEFFDFQDSEQGLYDAIQYIDKYLEGQLKSVEEILLDAGQQLVYQDFVSSLRDKATIESDSETREVISNYESMLSQLGLEIAENILNPENDEKFNIQQYRGAVSGSELNIKYNEAIRVASKAIDNLLTGFDEELVTIYNSLNTFNSSEQLRNTLTSYSLDENTISGYISLFNEQTQQARERALLAIKNSFLVDSNLNELFNDEAIDGELSTQYVDTVINSVNQANTLFKKGFTTRANLLSQAIFSLYSSIGKIDDRDLQTSIYSIVKNISWTDASSINSAISSLKAFVESNPDSAPQLDSTLKALQSAKNNLIINLQTEIQSYRDVIAGSVEKMTENVSGLADGFDLADALGKVDSLTAVEGFEDLSFNDLFVFDETLGKYVYSTQGFAAATKLQQQKLASEQKTIEEAIHTLEGIKLGQRVTVYRPERIQEIFEQDASWAEKAEQLLHMDRLDENQRAIVEDALSSFDPYGNVSLSEYLTSYVKDLGEEYQQITAEAENLVQEELRQLKAGLDIENIISGTASDRAAQRNTLTQLAIKRYSEGLLQTGSEGLAALINHALEGDEEALKQILGEQATYEDNLSIFETKKENLSSAISKLIEGGGVTLEEAEVNVLDENLFEEKDGVYFIKEQAGNLVSAVTKLIDDSSLTLQEQNEFLAEAFEKQNQNLFTKADLASKTTLDYSDLAELATLKGEQLSEDFISTLEQSLLKQNDFTGEFEIIDFDSYWAYLGNSLDEKTVEYLEAYSDWVDDQIAKETNLGEAASASISDLLDAKIGDKINVVYLEAAVKDAETSLANVFANYGVTIDQGMATIGENANLYGIIQEIARLESSGALEISDSLGELKDTIQEMFESWISSLSAGLAGNLSNTDAETLKQQFGFLTDTDFSRTKEGLKISKQAAYELYQHLKDVDSISSQLALDALVESAMEAEQGMNDIYQVMDKIRDLNEKISKVSYGSERYKALKSELEVAEGIRDTLLDAGNAYNFMDRDLPTALTNPMSAWEGVGDALKILDGDEFVKEGNIDFTSLYNMITMMNEMGADLTDASIGLTNDLYNTKNALGEAKTQEEVVLDLVRSMSDATIVVDGEPVIDISKMYEDGFVIGTEEMRKGIATGMEDLARSQIDIIDAQIELLEIIVAMEEISDIDVDADGIELEELFSFNAPDGTFDSWDEVTGITEEHKDFLEGLLKSLEENEKLKEQMDHTLVNGRSLTYIMTLMNGAFNPDGSIDLGKLKAMGLSVEQYLALVKGIEHMVESGDYDLATIMSSVTEQLSQGFSGSGLTLDFGGKTMVFTPDGLSYEINWGENGELVKQINNQLSSEGGYDQSSIREAIERVLSGKGDGADQLIFHIATGTITVQVDEITEEVTYQAPDGTAYSNPYDAILNAATAGLQKKEEAENTNLELGDIGETGAKATFSLNGTEVTVISNENGTVWIGTGADGTLIRATSKKDFIEQYAKTMGEDTTYEQAAAKLGISVDFEINPSAVNSASPQQIQELANAYVSGNNDDFIRVAKEIQLVPEGVTIDPNDQTKINELASAAGLSNVPVNVSLTISGLTGDDSLKLTKGLDSIKTSLSIIAGLDFTNVSTLTNSLSGMTESTASGLQGIKDILDELTSKGYTIELAYNITTTNTQEGSYDVSINDAGASQTLGNLATSIATLRGQAITATTAVNDFTVDSFTTNLDTMENSAVEAGNAFATAASQIAVAKKDIVDLKEAIKTLPDRSSQVQRTANAMNNLKSRTITATVKVNVNVDRGAAVSSRSITMTNSRAKGNVALAKGTSKAKGSNKTLMGELGPELVVSNGRYFTVGNNGAEFVDLPSDAIVFNHLQTKKLLGAGGSVGTGEPVTNERSAVALAGGNATGPAMASASEALAELYKLKAMWEGLLSASASELGKKAGSGLGSGKKPSGGGGGGGGGGGSGEDPKAYIHDLERWYNLLRQIEKLEQQITYEQAKRENMRNGYKYSESLQKELELLRKQKAAHEELAKLQKSYYEARRKDLESTDYAKIFTYDKDGLMQYVNGKNRGLDVLATLNETDANGKAKRDAKQQLAYLKSIGFDISVLKTNADGSKAETEEDQMQNFWDGIDGWMEEMDSLYDSYNEAATAAEEATQKMNEILQEYIDNQLEVEQKLLKAIEDREQAEIDRIQDEKDALEEAAQEYIDGLNDALSKEREMYDKNETEAETARLQRRLAILQRSGGSTSEIKALQDQIDSRLKDAYFQEQQDQIDAIQEASDKQIEKLQKQIDLMTETLEYQKENGLLWQEVYQMINNWTPEAMLQFIEQYTQKYQQNSALQNQQDSEETLQQLQMLDDDRARKERESAWTEYYTGLKDYSDDVKEKHKEGARAAFEEAYKKEGESAAIAAANKYYEAATKTPTPQDPSRPEEEEETETSPDTEKITGKGTVKTKGSNLNVRSGPGTSYKKIGKLKNKSSVTLTGYKNKWYQIDYNGETGYVHGDYIKTDDKKKLPAFKSGGLVDFTGPAWVDGSKSKPEAFLSAEDTAMLKSKIFSDSDGSLKALVAALEAITSNTSRYSATTTTESIVIQNAQVNIQPGTISNDYEARRAGEMALEEMVKIARKTTNRVVSR